MNFYFHLLKQMYTVSAISKKITRGTCKKIVGLERNSPFLLYNMFSLWYFPFKIFVHVNETENILHAFYKHIIFLGPNLSMLIILLISPLYYACNMLENA